MNVVWVTQLELLKTDSSRNTTFTIGTNASMAIMLLSRLLISSECS